MHIFKAYLLAILLNKQPPYHINVYLKIIAM